MSEKEVEKLSKNCVSLFSNNSIEKWSADSQLAARVLGIRGHIESCVEKWKLEKENFWNVAINYARL